jgi:hypothetical protein
MAARPRLSDAFRQVLTRGDSDLFTDQIATVDFFSHRVFDLNPSIHFHEIKVPILSTRYSIVPAFS